MEEIHNHSIEERLNGICRACTLNAKEIKACLAYSTIGDRACDNRHIPGFDKTKDKLRICINNKINGNI